jgi:hypothetical protein
MMFKSRQNLNTRGHNIKRMSIINVEIYPQDSKPFGLTFSEWSAKWWQWLLSISKPLNPAMDSSGENASIGQSNSNVFFLCQTIENVKSPIRKISIRKGTSLFLPIINWASNFYEHGKSERELIKTATEKIDVIGNLKFNLNGINIQGLEKYRFRSKFFTVELPQDNILGLPAGKARLISDGYWIFTKPIDTDTRISTFGTCSSGVTKIGVNYSIKVIQ